MTEFFFCFSKSLNLSGKSRIEYQTDSRKSKEIRRNQKKSNEIKKNQTKSTEIKGNQKSFHLEKYNLIKAL